MSNRSGQLSAPFCAEKITHKQFLYMTRMPVKRIFVKNQATAMLSRFICFFHG
jgi:hypothetical protein